MIHKWAFQWKMNFNPDPTKKLKKSSIATKQKSSLIPPKCFIMQKLLNQYIKTTQASYWTLS